MLSKRWPRMAVDAFLVAFAWLLAFWLRFNFELTEPYASMAYASLALVVPVFLAALGAWGSYRHVWRYTSINELKGLGFAVVVAAGLSAAAVFMLRIEAFPRAVLVLHPIIALLLFAAARAGWRIWFEGRGQRDADAKPVLVLGSHADAAQALASLRNAHLWNPVGIVTTNAREVGTTIQSVRVMGTVAELQSVVNRTAAQAVLVASPPGSAQRREAMLGAGNVGVPWVTLPRADEWLGGADVAPRRVRLEDLLGRESVALDSAGLTELVSGQTVLVTGAGGSIGAELCRQICRFGVSRLVCVDVSEYASYAMEQELRAAHPQVQVSYYTANVRELGRLEHILREHAPAVVMHAAAYKHVPLMEERNEIEAIRTNVLGTLNAARAAGAVGVKRFVMVSTDKAVNPTNVMGATKRMAELVVQAVAQEFPATQYVSVRFGNVLGSSGSVVPLFEKQIAAGGPVTVTHPEIVRYFMTIPEAVQLVLQAGMMGHSGQIFVLDMGDPVKIVELARMMIRLSGKTEAEVPIRFSGLRPGEKLYEELLADDETTAPTPHPKLRVARYAQVQVAPLPELLGWIESAGPAPSAADVRRFLRRWVPEYAPQA